MRTLLVLKVNQEDMGTVIKREGNTIKAIRSLVRIIGLKNNVKVNLKFEETSKRKDKPIKKKKKLDDL